MDFSYIILIKGVKVEQRVIKKHINKISSSADGTKNANTVCKQKSKSNKNILITKFLLPFTLFFLSCQANYVATEMQAEVVGNMERNSKQNC